MRRLLAGAVVCALMLAPSAAAAEGPQLGLLHLDSKLAASVQTLGTDGGTPATLWPAAGRGARPFFLSSIAWSGDGRYLITTGLSGKGEADGPSVVSLFAVPVDGGAPMPILGTGGGLRPVGLPDGETVAFTRVRGHDSETVSNEGVIQRSRSQESLWLVRLDGGPSRRLTPWRSERSEFVSSASPDGRTLVVRRLTRDSRKRKPPRSHASTLFLDLDSGKETAAGRDIADAVFSPDGTRLALVKERRFARARESKSKDGGVIRSSGETNLYVRDLLTGATTKVTSGPASDGTPSWDPSGSRLAFVRLGSIKDEAGLFGIGDSVYEVNADGSCLTRVLHEASGGYLSVVWRPGAEHAAGPIAC